MMGQWAMLKILIIMHDDDDDADYEDYDDYDVHAYLLS